MRNAATPSEPTPLPDLARAIVRRQATLSLRIASAFVAALIGLPILNATAPGAMNIRLGGFTLSWLLLAVVFYAFTWVLAKIFVVRSEAVEQDLAARHAGDARHRHVEDRARGERTDAGGRA